MALKNNRSPVLLARSRVATRILVVEIILTAILVVFTLFHSQPAHAVTNQNLNFQARLQTNTGAIVPDGYYNIEFKLYNAASSSGSSQGSCTGDANCVWTETRYDSNGVTAGNDNRVRVKNGYLTVNLGSITSFPSTIPWDQQLWITMRVGGSAQTATPTYDPEMSPRLQLTGVPYAFRAGQLATGNGTLQSTLEILQPTVGNQIFQIADQGAAGTYNLCIQNSTACGFAPASGGANYIQNQTASPQSAGFNISGNGTIGGNLNVTGDTNLFKPTSNSTTAFQIQPASSTTPVFNVDTTNGRVGIGTAAPAYKLHIADTGSAAITLEADSDDIGENDNPYIRFVQDGGSHLSRIGMVGDAGQVYTDSLTNAAYFGTLNNDSLQFISNGAAKLTILNGTSGNVGIGNTNPGYKLDVTGDINSSTGYRVAGAAGLASLACTGGQLLQNATVAGGIITAGSCASGGAGVTTVGTIDSQTKSANGAVISGTSIYMQTADATNPGLVSTTSQTFAGAKTFNDGVITGDSININGTGTGNNYRLNVGGTLQSTSTGSQYGIQNQVSFNPQGASLSNIYGNSTLATVSGSSLNLGQVVGMTAGIATAAGYTGTIASGVGLLLSAPTVGGSQLITDYRGISLGANSTNTGNTTGTINNYQLRIAGNTTAAGTGGTMNNYSAYIGVPSGSGGTTNNYGLYLTGNGGGTSSYAIYNNSTAANYLQGNTSIGTTSNPNGYALTVSGDINTSVGYRIGNISALTSSNLTFTAASAASIQAATTQALTVDSGTTGALNLGTSADAKTITIGNVTGATSLVLNAGTGNIDVGTTAQARTTNIATGAAAQIVTVGSNTGSSSLTLQSGTNIRLYTESTGGGTLVKSVTTDSTAAFYVQDAGGNTEFQIDTANGQYAFGANGVISGARLAVRTTGTLNILQLLDQSSNTVFTVDDDGSTIIKPSTGDIEAFEVQNTSGSTVLGVDTTGDGKVQIGSATSNNTIRLLVLDSYNQAADPTGVAGAMYYNTSKKTFRCYDNDTWKNCIGMDADNQRRQPIYSCDFLDNNVASCSPWTMTAISSGTLSPQAGNANHPAVMRYSSSTTVGSGYRINTSATSAYLIGGGESFELIFKPVVTTNTVLRFGHTDSNTSTDATDGVYFEMSGTTLSGKTANNSTRSTTGTTYTVTSGTWYRARLVVNSNASTVNYYVYDESGTQLWTNSLSTNIPTAAGRETGAGLVAVSTGNAANGLIDADYMAMWYTDRTLTR